MAGFLLVITAAGASAQVRSADDLCPPGDDPCLVTGTFTIESGAVLDFGDRDVQVVEGTLDVGTGDFEIQCGSFSLDQDSEILGRGNAQEFGGDVQITATNAVVINGTIDVSGSPAGSLSVNAGGIIDLTGGRLDGDGIGADGDGLLLDLIGGELNIAGPISGTGGSDASGGLLTLDSKGDITLDDQIAVTGGEGDGGDLTISAGQDIVITENAVLKLDASGFGFGGELSVTAGSSGQQGATGAQAGGLGSLTIRGKISARGGSHVDGGGDGGPIELTAPGACHMEDTDISTNGGSPDGSGSELTIECGDADGTPITATGRLGAKGLGTDSSGGEILLSMASPLVLAATLDATGGQSGGGFITVESAGAITVTGQLTADSNGADAGSVTVTARGNDDADVTLTADASISASGNGTGGLGGVVALEGCVARINQSARASATGSGGIVSVTGANLIEVAGSLTADMAAGFVELVFRDAPPSIEATSQIIPDPVERFDPALPGCGAPPTSTPTTTSTPGGPTPTRTPSPVSTSPPRVTPTPTKTRTRAPTRTPTATPTLVPTPAGPADANCDGSIDESGLTELNGLTRTVFDSRWFDEQLCVTPDANGDGRVNAADYPALLGLLRP